MPYWGCKLLQLKNKWVNKSRQIYMKISPTFGFMAVQMWYDAPTQVKYGKVEYTIGAQVESWCAKFPGHVKACRYGSDQNSIFGIMHISSRFLQNCLQLAALFCVRYTPCCSYCYHTRPRLWLFTKPLYDGHQNGRDVQGLTFSSVSKRHQD